jgi:ribosome-associated heat shock protein Hsp15
MATEAVRLDKWLWAARFFKTRRLAMEACDSGRVLVDGNRAKPARALHPGERLEIRKDGLTWVVDVLALSAQRGPASVAATLYRETEEGRGAREALALQLRADAQSVPRPQQRPEKHARRELARFKRGD